jgi:pilus assembly protein Flp/PilA
MQKFVNPLRALLARTLASISARQRGATATEYGLLVGFAALAIVIGVGLFGAAVNDWFVRLTLQLITALS